MGNELSLIDKDNRSEKIINQSLSDNPMKNRSIIKNEAKIIKDENDKSKPNSNIIRAKNMPDLLNKNNNLNNTNNTNVESTNTTNFLSLESLNSKINLCDISFTDYNNNKLSDLFDTKLVLYKSFKIDWDENANEVILYGSFNNWIPLTMIKSNDSFTLTLVSYFFNYLECFT